MYDSQASPLRFPWSALLWFLAAVLLLLLIGVWTETQWWQLMTWVIVPVMVAVIISAVSSRRTVDPDGAYGITTRWARSVARLTVEASTDQVMAAVKHSAEEWPRFTAVEVSATGARLAAQMNLKTWGERITLRFRPTAWGGIEIDALCEPSWGITLIDYGQGAADLRQLLRAIEHHLAGVDRVR